MFRKLQGGEKMLYKVFERNGQEVVVDLFSNKRVPGIEEGAVLSVVSAERERLKRKK